MKSETEDERAVLFTIEKKFLQETLEEKSCSQIITDPTSLLLAAPFNVVIVSMTLKSSCTK